MTIREMIEALEAIEKEHGNVKVVNGRKNHCDDTNEEIKLDFVKAGPITFGGVKMMNYHTEVRIF